MHAATEGELLLALHRDVDLLEAMARLPERIELVVVGDGPMRGPLEERIARLGLRGREDLPVRFLSAGQKRRVLLARLVTRKAALWILDEPFTALDVKAVEMLSGLIGEHLSAGGMAVLTSHQALPLAAGKIVDLSSPEYLPGGEGR